MTSLGIDYIEQSSSQRSQGRMVEAFSSFIHAQKLIALALPVGLWSGVCSRISICFFLLRIFQSVRAWRLGLYAIIAFATVAAIPTFTILVAHCQPLRKEWDPRSSGTCWPRIVLNRTNYVYGGKYQCALTLFTSDLFTKVLPGASVLLDWILATLPIVFMWNLQMRVRVKVGICALMGMGYL